MSESIISMRNSRGEWMPAIPLPFYGVRKKCQCGAKFWTTKDYEKHYAYEHIVMGRLPL